MSHWFFNNIHTKVQSNNSEYKHCILTHKSQNIKMVNNNNVGHIFPDLYNSISYLTNNYSQIAGYHCGQTQHMKNLLEKIRERAPQNNVNVLYTKIISRVVVD